MSNADDKPDKATPRYRWIDGSPYLDPTELANSKSFQEKVKQTAELEQQIRGRKSRSDVG